MCTIANEISSDTPYVNASDVPSTNVSKKRDPINDIILMLNMQQKGKGKYIDYAYCVHML